MVVRYGFAVLYVGDVSGDVSFIFAGCCFISYYQYARAVNWHVNRLVNVL